MEAQAEQRLRQASHALPLSRVDESQGAGRADEHGAVPDGAGRGASQQAPGRRGHGGRARAPQAAPSVPQVELREPGAEAHVRRRCARAVVAPFRRFKRSCAACTARCCCGCVPAALEQYRPASGQALKAEADKVAAAVEAAEEELKEWKSAARQEEHQVQAALASVEGCHKEFQAMLARMQLKLEALAKQEAAQQHAQGLLDQVLATANGKVRGRVSGDAGAAAAGTATSLQLTRVCTARTSLAARCHRGPTRPATTSLQQGGTARTRAAPLMQRCTRCVRAGAPHAPHAPRRSQRATSWPPRRRAWRSSRRSWRRRTSGRCRTA